MKKNLAEKIVMFILGILMVPVVLIPWFALKDMPEQIGFLRIWTLPSFGMGAVMGCIFMFTLRFGYKMLQDKIFRILITVLLAGAFLVEIALTFVVLYIPYNGYYFYTSQFSIFVAYWFIYIGKQWGLKKLRDNDN